MKNENNNAIDIAAIIKQYNITQADAAQVLFPKAKFPLMALNRILKGLSDLTASQIKALADYLGVFPADLYGVKGWSGKSKQGYLTLTKGPYTVKLAYKGTYLSIFKDKELIYQVLTATQDMSVRKFIEYIDEIINNLKTTK